MPSDWPTLEGESVDVAPRLLGSLLIRELHGRRLVGKIVETEAYDQTDAASHSFYGSSGRAAVTFGPAGRLYVHAIRQHFCCDVTTGPEGYGSSVLIRAIEPLEGVEVMRDLRHSVPDQQLTNGPGKACQAFGIDTLLNGHNLHQAPLQLMLRPVMPPEQIVRTTRIGVTKDGHRLWRFYIKNSLYISRL